MAIERDGFPPSQGRKVKVFCDDCKWQFIVVITRYCRHPMNMNGFGRSHKDTLYMDNCLKHNKNGNCGLYKRKWWKIWRPK